MAYINSRTELENKANLVDGGWCWKSNGSYLMSDLLIELYDANIITREERLQTRHNRDIQTAKYIAEYKKAQAQRTPEQIAEHQAELRSAFGEGETIVNALTGETVTL
jgi:hypothetical protein